MKTVFGLVLILLFSACAPGTTSIPGAFKPNPRPVSEEEAAQALAVAQQFEGTPYEWGGRGPDSFDSSGIIVHAYREVIPDMRLRTSEWDAAHDAPHRLIYYWNIEPLELEELQPGDLVYITDGSDIVTHGAFFVAWVEPYEVMRFFDASGYKDQVGFQEWPVEGEKRNQYFVGGGRLKVIRGPKN